MRTTPKTIARPGAPDPKAVKLRIAFLAKRDLPKRMLEQTAGGGYLVPIFRLIFTVGRVSNWLTVLVSLLEPLY